MNKKPYSLLSSFYIPKEQLLSRCITLLIVHCNLQQQTKLQDGSGKDGKNIDMITDLQCVLKWGRNLYDIDIAFESGLQFKERVEKLTRKVL